MPSFSTKSPTEKLITLRVMFQIFLLIEKPQNSLRSVIRTSNFFLFGKILQPILVENYK